MMTNILQYLEQNAQRFPDRNALSDEFRTLTYREYWNAAQIIGTYLVHNVTGGEINRPIAVWIDRNVYSVAAFLGIVASGNFYVPMDASLPADRKQAMIDSLRPLAILDAREQAEGDREHVVAELLEQPIKIDKEALASVRRRVMDIDPLYAIFTSGSTGMPKGVVVSHGSVIDLTEAFGESFSFREGTVFGNQAPFDFDVSVKDIYNSLYCCGTVEIIPKRMFLSPKLLVEYLESRKINTLIWAVSALRIVADFKVLDTREYHLCLENIMFSGEVMPIRVLNYWRSHLPECRYVNLYGPTEITCNCTYYLVDREYALDEVLPVGIPFPNTRVLLRDEAGKVVQKPGQLGEICVVGRCVALGYWGDAEKTSGAFLQSPEQDAYRSIAYATGDLGYYLEDGNLVFVSRKDHQIKHMGHRIELGEIEAALNALDFLVAAVCVYSSLKEKIICFYQSVDRNDCRKQIAVALSRKLPKYMLPSVYCGMQELPLNKNGKIDRVLLRKEWEKENG